MQGHRTASGAPRVAGVPSAWPVGAGLGLVLLALPGTAIAQTSTLLLPPATTSGDAYDRGHNISVSERPRPEYDPLGIRLGSFILSPQLSTSAAYSNNVFNDNRNRTKDVYTSIEPYVSVASDWSVHQVRLTAAGDVRRYAQESVRNQDAWYVALSGRVEATRALTVSVNTEVDRSYETPFSGDVVANLRAPSRYLRRLAGTRAVYDIGKSRVIATLDRNRFTFETVQFADGTIRDQRSRDRVADSGTVTYELGFSPSLSIYGRAEIDRNQYDTTIFGRPNRDSVGYRAIAGTNFDFAGVARGSIAVGYSYRRFEASDLYRNASGLSFEAKADWFPSELTTVGVLAQRRLIDVDLAGAGTTWDNRARVTVDHELLYNLIVTIGGEIGKRDYPERSASTSLYRAETSARYQVTRWLGLSADIGYGSTNPSTTTLGNPFDELRGRVSVRIRR